MSTTVKSPADFAGRWSRRAARLYYLDAFRGLAILAMMVDHAALLFNGPGWLRLTVGRLAMPMFFALAGTLAGRVTGRHAAVAATGLALPLVVPWIDSPNVLVWWAVGAVALAGCRRLAVSPGVVAVVALGMGANGWLVETRSYSGPALVGLMAVGALLPRSWYVWAGRAPRWVAAMGRAPIRWYVGHVLVFTFLAGLVVLHGR